MSNKLKVDLVMGAQWGSEAKGIFAKHLGLTKIYDWLASCNTRNAGHTVYYRGEKLVARYLPCSAVSNHISPILITAGTNINKETLEEEIENFEYIGVPIKNRLLISECAGILTHEHEEIERTAKLNIKLGSTMEGVGASLVDRVMRKSPLFIDKYGLDYEFVSDDKMFGSILLEGSQGYLLSNLSSYYPYTTSRICNASAYLSYAKLPPSSIRDVYGVFRTWPIRVANRTKKPLDNGGIWDPTDSSGSMGGLEVSWSEVRQFCGATEKELPTEYTTVTKLPRRIARWNPKDARLAIRENGITRPCLSFLNYIDWNVYGINSYSKLTEKVKEWIYHIERRIDMKFDLLSTDPDIVFARK